MKEKQQKAFETLDEYLQDISGLTDHQYHWIKIAMEDYAKRYASSLQPSQVDEEGIKALAKKWIETNWSNGNYDDHCMDDVYNAMVEMYKAAASSIPSNGMGWVKASERLPRHQRNMIIKLAGELYIADFQPDNVFLAASFDTQQRLLNFDWFEQIEWLDESASSIPLDTVVYIPVSVEDELPDADEGLFIVKLPGGWIEVFYDKHYSFHMEFTDCSGITHWLKKTTIGELKK